MPRYRKYPLFIQNRREKWFADTINFIEARYMAILDRFVHTFRFLDFHPLNAHAFSYEYASLFRDTGSCFSSVLDNILKNSDVKPMKGKNYTIRDFSRYLNKNVDDIRDIGICLDVEYDQKYVYPFRNFGTDEVSAVWWNAYNNLKHNELNSMPAGCLSNLIYIFAALTIIYDAVTKRNEHSSMFSIITQGLVGSIIDGTVPREEYHFPQAS